MARISLSALAGPLIWLVSVGVSSDAITTTWRPFDTVRYRAGCHDQEAALRAAESGPAMVNPIWAELLQSGRCFLMREEASAQLLEWIAGPYVVLDGEPASIWLVRDEFGDEEYILLTDVSGPHEASLLV